MNDVFIFLQTNLNIILIFVWIYAAMIAMSFWESYVEGKNPWDKKKLGWKIKLTKRYCLPAYHFYLFWVMWPLLLTLPFIIYGWDVKLCGILLSAYLSGMVIEDFFWFVVNPQWPLKDFNSKKVDWYPWVKIGKIEIPLFYIINIFLAIIIAIWLIVGEM